MVFKTRDNKNVEAMVATSFTGTATVNAAIGYREYY